MESCFSASGDSVSFGVRYVHGLCQMHHIPRNHFRSDEDINTGDASTPLTPVPIACPLTHARARQLNHQVSSFLSSCPSCLDLGNTCTFVLIRKKGEDRKGQGLTLARFRLQRKHQIMTITTVAYGFGLGYFRTCWKAYKVYFHMSAVPQQYLFGRSGKDPITFERSCCLGCCVILFWDDGPCIKLGPLGTCPRVKPQPWTSFGHPLEYLRSLQPPPHSWVLIRSSLAFATCL